MRSLSSFLSSKSGASNLEYALLIGIVAMGALGSVVYLGKEVSSLYVASISSDGHAGSGPTTPTDPVDPSPDGPPPAGRLFIASGPVPSEANIVLGQSDFSSAGFALTLGNSGPGRAYVGGVSPQPTGNIMAAQEGGTCSGFLDPGQTCTVVLNTFINPTSFYKGNPPPVSETIPLSVLGYNGYDGYVYMIGKGETPDGDVLGMWSEDLSYTVSLTEAKIEYAASQPVLSGGGHGAKQVVAFHAPFSHDLTIVNVGTAPSAPLPASSFVYNQGSFTLQDNCHGKILPPNGSCTVRVFGTGGSNVLTAAITSPVMIDDAFEDENYRGSRNAGNYILNVSP